MAEGVWYWWTCDLIMLIGNLKFILGKGNCMTRKKLDGAGEVSL